MDNAGVMLNRDVTAFQFGRRPWYGIAGLLGGVALCGAGLFLWSRGVGGGRSGKLYIYLGGFALASLGTTFRIRGCRLNADGIELWDYWFWIFGSRQLILPEKVQSFVLGECDKKFTVSIQHAEGTFEIPQQWASVKDAQSVVDFGTEQYGAQADVAITDEGVLREAAEFAQAVRYAVQPAKDESGEFTDRLVCYDSDGEVMGEIRVRKRFFRAGYVEIPEGATDLEPRWRIKGRVVTSAVELFDGDETAGILKGCMSWIGKHAQSWTDRQGTRWMALTEFEGEKKSPFSMKLYRGIVDGVGSKAERKESELKQGAPELVAIISGPAEEFTIDLADESAWPWVRIALGLMWMQNRPTFEYAKSS